MDYSEPYPSTIKWEIYAVLKTKKIIFRISDIKYPIPKKKKI